MPKALMHTVAETPTFARQAEQIFHAEQLHDLIGKLARDPCAGDEIPETGGVRKLRVPALGRGKRGGARVIYYYFNDRLPLYLLLAYAKSRQTDITPAQKRELSAFALAMKEIARRGNEHVRGRPDPIAQGGPGSRQGGRPGDSTHKAT